MKKVDRKKQLKMSAKQAERLNKARVSYEKMIQEVAPFVPKFHAKEVSTEGKWQSTSNLSLY